MSRTATARKNARKIIAFVKEVLNAAIENRQSVTFKSRVGRSAYTNRKNGSRMVFLEVGPKKRPLDARVAMKSMAGL